MSKGKGKGGRRHSGPTGKGGNKYIPKSESWKLDNGLRIFRNPREEMNSVEIQAFVGLGSCDDPKKLTGITHLLEHLIVFSPTHSFPRKGEIDELLERIGGYMDGETFRLFTKFSGKFPVESTEIALNIFKERLFYNSLDSEVINSEKERILQEIQGVRDEPSEYLLDLLFDARGLASILGNRESVSKIDGDSIKDFYDHFYTPSSVWLGISSPDYLQVKKKVEKCFGGLESQDLKEKKTKETILVKDSNRSVSRPDLQQIYFVLSFPIQPFSFEEEHVIYLLHHLVDPILREIRSQGLVYNIYSDHFLLPKGGFFYIAGDTKNEDTLNKITDVLEDKFKKGEFLNEEALESAKKKEIQSLFISWKIHQTF